MTDEAQPEEGEAKVTSPAEPAENRPRLAGWSACGFVSSRPVVPRASSRWGGSLGQLGDVAEEVVDLADDLGELVEVHRFHNVAVDS